jgi:hypothetical protein
MMSDPELRHLQGVIADLYNKLDFAVTQLRDFRQAVERHKVVRMSNRLEIQPEDMELWDSVLRQTPQ